MHRQSSTRALKLLRFGALHFLFNFLLLPTAVVLMMIWLVLGNREWLLIGSITVAVLILSVIMFFLIHRMWQCPLCMGRIWIRQGCRRHQKAVTAFGMSCRLGVALSVVKKQSYRCPYCGDPFSSHKTARK